MISRLPFFCVCGFALLVVSVSHIHISQPNLSIHYEGSTIKTVSEASVAGSPFVKALLAAIETTNKDEMACPMNAARVQKFTILPRDFSVATDELTPTFKLKRGAVHEKYHDVIEAMYKCKDPYFQCPPM
jgi:long-subunit acyl-CoA synthetase (AMP-forming)